jgi:ribose transport system permease protein
MGSLDEPEARGDAQPGAPSAGTLPKSARRERPAREIVNRYLSKYALLIALIGLVVFFSAIRPHTFGTLSNFEAIATAETPVIILAFAEMVVLIIGRIDLSIGATFSLSSVAAADLILKHQVTPVLGIGIAVCAAAAIGLVNGLLVALGRIDAFVVTLATWTVVNGLVLLFTNGVSIYGRSSGVFGSLTAGSLAGVPLLLVYAVAATLLLAVLLSSFPAGRRMYATGSNERAAKLSGIRTSRYVVLTFVGGALLAGLAGVLLASNTGAGTPGVGDSLLIPAITAAFLGGTSVTPGRFNPVGTLIAAYLIAVAVAGLQQLGAAQWVTPVFNGLMLLVAVSVSLIATRTSARRARAARLQALNRRPDGPQAPSQAGGIPRRLPGRSVSTSGER